MKVSSEIEDIFDRFKNHSYNFSNGPVAPVTEVEQNGLNCQRFVHEIYDSMGVMLPFWMMSKEIFEDREIFRFVKNEPLQVFDIFVFGKEGEPDYKKLHLAIFSGAHDVSSEPLLWHASSVDRKVAQWPLREFGSHSRYEILYGVKRLQDFMIVV